MDLYMHKCKINKKILEIFNIQDEYVTRIDITAQAGELPEIVLTRIITPDELKDVKMYIIDEETKNKLEAMDNDIKLIEYKR